VVSFVLSFVDCDRQIEQRQNPGRKGGEAEATPPTWAGRERRGSKTGEAEATPPMGARRGFSLAALGVVVPGSP
jgi:hypothetical protein